MKYFCFYNSYSWLDLNFFEFLNNYCVFYEGLKQFKCIEGTSFLLIVAVWWNRFRMMEYWKNRLISFFICSQHCRRRERILKMQKKKASLYRGLLFCATPFTFWVRQTLFAWRFSCLWSFPQSHEFLLGSSRRWFWKFHFGTRKPNGQCFRRAVHPVKLPAHLQSQ